MQENSLAHPPFHFFPGEVEVFAARSGGSTYKWARRNMRIVAGPYEGRLWDPSTLPYARKVMDIWDSSWVRKVFFIAPSQSGKTTLAHACLFSAMVNDPGPAGIAMPDQNSAELMFKKRLHRHVQTSRVLRERLSGRNGLLQTEIRFRDGSDVVGMWSGSESSVSSQSIQYLLIDEEDAYPDKASVGIIEERVTAYRHTGKIFRFCKPRGAEGEGTIYSDMYSQSQVVYRYYAVCPACGSEQRMTFDRIVVPDRVRDPACIESERSARYECAHCNYRWNDPTRDEALSSGRWIPDRDVSKPETVGFHLRAWELPFVSLSKIMASWFAAQGDPVRLQVWDNHFAAKPYKTVISETTEQELLRLKEPELEPLTVPAGAIALTCGVDMQARGFYYSVMAHAIEPYAGWVIDYGRLEGWDDVRRLIFEASYHVVGGVRRMSIWRASLDTGGGRTDEEIETRTEQAYRFLMGIPPGVCFGTKGMSRKSTEGYVKWSDIVKLPSGKRLPGFLRLYQLDTDYFKRLALFSRLKESAEEPIRFHNKTGINFVRQLLAEKLVRRKTGKEEWKQVRRDNHYLDTIVQHMAMVHFQWTPALVAVQPERQPTQQKTASNQAKRRGWW